MINWDELKHIHVIRKFEEILAQWFHTDIFFVDERGTVRNYDPLDRQREFKSPLAGMWLPKEKGRPILLKALAEANEKAFKTTDPHIVLTGPCGFEQFLVSRISL